MTETARTGARRGGAKGKGLTVERIYTTAGTHPYDCLLYTSGSGKTSSTTSSARIGPPAAIRPTTGTYDASGRASPLPVGSTGSSMTLAWLSPAR